MASFAIFRDRETFFRFHWNSFNYVLFPIAPKKHCGGILNSTSGWMQSLDRDNDGFYDTNLECIWTIEAKEYDVIVLHFMYMDIKGNFGCTDGDYIEVSVKKYLNTYLNGLRKNICLRKSEASVERISVSNVI